eukprot:10862496-Alexandrium_andersonii.AAC.1
MGGMDRLVCCQMRVGPILHGAFQEGEPSRGGSQEGCSCVEPSHTCDVVPRRSVDIGSEGRGCEGQRTKNLGEARGPSHG